MTDEQVESIVDAIKGVTTQLKLIDFSIAGLILMLLLHTCVGAK